jgi:hypothetical protein
MQLRAYSASAAHANVISKKNFNNTNNYKIDVLFSLFVYSFNFVEFCCSETSFSKTETRQTKQAANETSTLKIKWPPKYNWIVAGLLAQVITGLKMFDAYFTIASEYTRFTCHQI